MLIENVYDSKSILFPFILLGTLEYNPPLAIVGPIPLQIPDPKIALRDVVLRHK